MKGKLTPVGCIDMFGGVQLATCRPSREWLSGCLHMTQRHRLSPAPPNAGIERLPARNAQHRRNRTRLMNSKLAGSPLE
jgi:hypothetical protein